MPLRVLHVAQPLDAGVPNVAGDLVADQVARGWDVAAACPEAGDLRGFALRAGARHLRWEAVRAPGPSSAREAAALARLVGEYAPDLVHLHSAKAGLAGRLAIRGARPTVFQPHSWSFEAARGAQQAAAIRWERFATRWADAVVCVSEDERERGRALGIRAGWAVLPNGVDLERLAPAGAAERSAARDGSVSIRGPIAVLVGRIAEQKGQFGLARLWPQVRARVPGARLVLVGDGPGRAELANPPRRHARGRRPARRRRLARAADVAVIRRCGRPGCRSPRWRRWRAGARSSPTTSPACGWGSATAAPSCPSATGPRSSTPWPPGSATPSSPSGRAPRPAGASPSATTCGGRARASRASTRRCCRGAAAGCARRSAANRRSSGATSRSTSSSTQA